MGDLGRHRGKHHYSLLSLAPITFDTNTFPCYGGSYFATIAVLFVICRRPLNRVGPSNAHIIIAAYYSDHCLLFRVCSFAELSSAFIITAPEGAAVVYINTSVIFFLSELHHTSMGHARLVCTQLYIGSYTSLSRSRYRFLFPPTDRSEGSHSCFPLQPQSQ
jgi:hypothetical protein